MTKAVFTRKLLSLSPADSLLSAHHSSSLILDLFIRDTLLPETLPEPATLGGYFEFDDEKTAMECYQLWVALGVVMLVTPGYLPTVLAQRQRKKGPTQQGEGSVTTKYVYKRVRIVEKKQQIAEDQLTNAIERIEYLANQLSAMQEERKKFSDDPPCPNATAPGFYYAASLNSCYHLMPSTTMLNWSESHEACSNLEPNAHLISLENEEEHDYIVARLRSERGIASFARYWTSGVYRDEEETWVWSITGDSMTYDKWIPTTRHNRKEFGCMAVPSAESFLWGDFACWVPSMVLCEVDL